MRGLYIIGPPVITLGLVFLVLLVRCQGSDPSQPDMLLRDLYPPMGEPSNCAIHLTGEMEAELCVFPQTRTRQCRCALEVQARDHQAPLEIVNASIKIGKMTSPSALRAGQISRQTWDCDVGDHGCGFVDWYNYAHVFVPEPYEKMPPPVKSDTPSPEAGEAP